MLENEEAIRASICEEMNSGIAIPHLVRPRRVCINYSARGKNFKKVDVAVQYWYLTRLCGLTNFSHYQSLERLNDGCWILHVLTGNL